jgi:hypothetical protein
VALARAVDKHRANFKKIVQDAEFESINRRGVTALKVQPRRSPSRAFGPRERARCMTRRRCRARAFSQAKWKKILKQRTESRLFGSMNLSKMATGRGENVLAYVEVRAARSGSGGSSGGALRLACS